MIRWALRLLALLVVIAAAGGLAVRSVAHDPARWHVNPAEAVRSGAPNDFLAAPAGTTVATPDLLLETRDPAAAMTALDRVARQAPRTEVVAGDPADGFVTYVQRSALIGFPDYVSVSTVEGGIAIWSRSRFGYSDLGVNGERVRRWLAAAEL